MQWVAGLNSALQPLNCALVAPLWCGLGCCSRTVMVTLLTWKLRWTVTMTRLLSKNWNMLYNRLCFSWFIWSWLGWRFNIGPCYITYPNLPDDSVTVTSHLQSRRPSPPRPGDLGRHAVAIHGTVLQVRCSGPRPGRPRQPCSAGVRGTVTRTLSLACAYRECCTLTTVITWNSISTWLKLISNCLAILLWLWPGPVDSEDLKWLECLSTALSLGPGSNAGRDNLAADHWCDGRRRRSTNMTNEIIMTDKEFVSVRFRHILPLLTEYCR